MSHGIYSVSLCVEASGLLDTLNPFILHLRTTLSFDSMDWMLFYSIIFGTRACNAIIASWGKILKTMSIECVYIIVMLVFPKQNSWRLQHLVLLLRLKFMPLLEIQQVS